MSLFLLRAAVAAAAILSPTFSLAAPTPAQKCEAAVETATAKFAQCRLNAEAKFTKDGDAGKRTASFERCSSRLSAAFVKATAVYGAACPVAEPVGEFDAFLAQCTDQVESAAAGREFPSCGDGVVNRAGEQCDGSDLGGETCSALGFVGGALSCTSGCSFDASACVTVSCAPGTSLRDNACIPDLVVALSSVPPEGYEFRGLTTDLWGSRGGLPLERGLLGLASVDGRLYAIGGRTPLETFSTRVEAYDPSTDSWTTRASMPTPREGFAVAAANGRIYAIGGVLFDGIDPAISLNVVEEYDPVSDVWTSKAPMPTDRAYLGAVSVNGKIYAIGGLAYDNGSTDMTTVEEYDPVGDVWTARTDMPQALWAFGAASDGHRVFVVRGGVPTLVYDPITDSWQTKAQVTEPAGASNAAVALAGKVYSLGGSCNNAPRCAQVAVYDPATDEWKPCAPLPTGRNFLAAAVVGESIYAVGGFTDTGPTNVVERYEPVAFLYRLPN